MFSYLHAKRGGAFDRSIKVAGLDMLQTKVKEAADDCEADPELPCRGVLDGGFRTHSNQDRISANGELGRAELEGNRMSHVVTRMYTTMMRSTSPEPWVLQSNLSLLQIPREKTFYLHPLK